MQIIMLVGRVGIKVKYVDNGTTRAATASVADNTYYTDKETNEKHQRTTWIPVVGFGKTAEFMKEYLSVGSEIAVKGTLRNSSYVKEDGTKINRLFVRADRIQLTGRKAEKQELAKEDTVNEGFAAQEDSFDNFPFGDDFEMPVFEE